MCHGDEALLGELPQRVEVCPHVQLAAHQHDLRVGAELLRLPLPLQRKGEPLVCVAFPNGVSQLFKYWLAYQGSLMSAKVKNRNGQSSPWTTLCSPVAGYALQTCPIQVWSPLQGHRRPALAVGKQQPHSLVLRSGTPRVNTASGELFAHSHTIYYWEPPFRDIMIFRA